jgi:putative intracellular protease/amidase
MKPRVYFFVFDGFADWEPAHAFCQIRKSGKHEVFTAGFSQQPVISMAGLKISPDVTIDEVDPQDTAFFMLPGGDMWEKQSHEKIKALLQRLHGDNVLIGAICAATLEIARAGLTRGIRHTSNAKKYLNSMVADYRDDTYYVEELAVSDKNIITASGLGSLEFAREVMSSLKVYSDADIELWFDMFKRGVVPAGMI